ncbi:hypothetical protein TWF225_001029 [Orbilia oligospora]|uniref:Uncharacterized protein n=1 Tax=Orbilia oligospora TaxID=2813651 RepID=A0A7C8PP51_ORBOL|nr:hypothetical protein TWF751_008793 [Orbilia oligospora]KAF3191813.1 hypothetical protein TWF225_001029 [Orbilia oligospora]KAF3237856.1 hypothetical protein TWF128_000743 [Orbilia oligospora]KAF3238433.1 hypothetical protein TWF217_001708 [Orbilia oligospora]KAF3273952.1 hypothetical protein TWF132_004473 [Orbilia oligospora]
MRPSSALSIFFLLASLSGTVVAQGNNNNNNGEQSSSAVTNKPASTGKEETPELPSPSSEPTKDAGSKTEDPKPAETNTKEEEKSSQAPAKTTPPPQQTEEAPSLESATKTSVTVVATGKSTGSSDDPPPPKYTPPDNSRYTIPKYPPPAVPNTKNAPYMQRSDLPEGTVFIAVGSALGLIGLIAFAWRMVVAWQLRRSIRKANSVTTDSKAGLLGRYNPPATANKSFYSAGAGSSLSLDHLGTASRTTGLGTTPNTSLFFSPTANNGNTHQRQSQYLPAGYYAPAASTNLPFNQSRDSLPRPRPATRDSHVVGTPPASPLLTPTARRPSPGQGHAQAPSISSTLGVPAGGRTPSTYLEDMLDNPFPEDPSAADQNRRSIRRKSGHSYGGGAAGGSRR